MNVLKSGGSDQNDFIGVASRMIKPKMKELREFRREWIKVNKSSNKLYLV